MNEEPEQTEEENEEEAIWQKQYAYITKHFGKTHADNANYGWSVDETCYMTKVYTSPKPSFVYTIHSIETDELETLTYDQEETA